MPRFDSYILYAAFLAIFAFMILPRAFALAFIVLAYLWAGAAWFAENASMYLSALLSDLVGILAGTPSLVEAPSIPISLHVVAILVLMAVVYHSVVLSDDSLTGDDPLAAIEESNSAPFRSLNSFGEFHRVERTPVVLSNGPHICAECSNSHVEGYRIERYVDTVYAGVTVDSERKGERYVCLGCEAADPIALALGTAEHLQDHDRDDVDSAEISEEAYVRYRAAYREWHTDRVDRIRSYERKLRNERQKAVKKAAAADRQYITFVDIERSAIRTAETLQGNIDALYDELERMSKREVPSSIPDRTSPDDDLPEESEVPEADEPTDADEDPLSVELAIWDSVLHELREYSREFDDENLDENIKERRDMIPDFAGELLSDPVVWNETRLAGGSVGAWTFLDSDHNPIAVYYRIPNGLDADERETLREKYNHILRSYGRDPDDGEYGLPKPIEQNDPDESETERSERSEA